jgi:hypothetical protein
MSYNFPLNEGLLYNGSTYQSQTLGTKFDLVDREFEPGLNHVKKDSMLRDNICLICTFFCLARTTMMFFTLFSYEFLFIHDDIL